MSDLPRHADMGEQWRASFAEFNDQPAAADVTARYDKGVLEVNVPVPAVKPEGTRIPVGNADAMPDHQPDQAG